MVKQAICIKRLNDSTTSKYLEIYLKCPELNNKFQTFFTMKEMSIFLMEATPRKAEHRRRETTYDSKYKHLMEPFLKQVFSLTFQLCKPVNFLLCLSMFKFPVTQNQVIPA